MAVKNNISFCVGNSVPICLDLKRMETGTKESLAVMQKADSLDGLKLISCTPARKCTLFQSNTSRLGWKFLQKITFSSFPKNLWYNDWSSVTVEDGKGSVYLITPDEVTLELHSYKHSQKMSWLEYIGKGKGFLSRREELLLRLKRDVMAQIRSSMNSHPVSGETQDDLPYDLSGLIYVSPEQLQQQYGLPAEFTPAEDIAVTSMDHMLLRFNDWLARNADDLPCGCTENAVLAVSMKPLSAPWGTVGGIYIYDFDTIALSPDVAGSFLNGDDNDLFTVAYHECIHNDFADYGIRDEPAKMMKEAFALVEMETKGDKRYGRRTSKAADRLKSEWRNWDAIGNELYASLSEPEIEHSIVNELFFHLVLHYTFGSAIYVCNWLEELLVNDLSMSAGKFARAMVITEKYKSYIKLLPLILSLDEMINEVVIQPLPLDHQADGSHYSVSPLHDAALEVLSKRSFIDSILELPFNLFRRVQNEIIS